MAIGVDTVLNGQFRLLEPLGAGGMGAVWRAEQLSLQAPVAIKLIHPEIALRSLSLERFRREAHAAAALRGHPHVVQLIDYGIDPTLQVPFIAMELLKGTNLRDYLTARARLTPAETLSIVTQVCKAAEAAHDIGLVHRDLKPDNIFLVSGGRETFVKVLDFGVAKQLVESPDTPKTTTGSVVGTAYYMSPEQIRGQAVDHRSDLWAIAVIAFECITGQRPFDAYTMGELTMRICSEQIAPPSSVATVPPGFDRWFLKATTRPREQRFQSARLLLEELTRTLEASGARSPLVATASVDAPPPIRTETGPFTASDVIPGSQGTSTASPRRSTLPLLVGSATLVAAAVAGLVLRSPTSATSIALESDRTPASTTFAVLAVAQPSVSAEAVTVPGLTGKAGPELGPSLSSASTPTVQSAAVSTTTSPSAAVPLASPPVTRPIAASPAPGQTPRQVSEARLQTKASQAAPPPAAPSSSGPAPKRTGGESFVTRN